MTVSGLFRESVDGTADYATRGEKAERTIVQEKVQKIRFGNVLMKKKLTTVRDWKRSDTIPAGHHSRLPTKRIVFVNLHTEPPPATGILN